RQGDEMDNHDTPTPDDLPEDWREIPERELEEHQWGLAHLDAASWHFHLPAFLAYSVRHFSRGESLVIAACLSSLRPPDRVPSRFRLLTDTQRQVVVSILEFLAFGCESDFSDAASQALEEYWIENPLYPDSDA